MWLKNESHTRGKERKSPDIRTWFFLSNNKTWVGAVLSCSSSFTRNLTAISTSRLHETRDSSRLSPVLAGTLFSKQSTEEQQLLFVYKHGKGPEEVIIPDALLPQLLSCSSSSFSGSSSTGMRIQDEFLSSPHGSKTHQKTSKNNVFGLCSRKLFMPSTANKEIAHEAPTTRLYQDRDQDHLRSLLFSCNWEVNPSTLFVRISIL